MKQVIDVRDMHTAIHSLYLVKSKPQTTLKAFENLAWAQDNDVDSVLDDGWLTIEENTEILGEVHWMNFKGDKVWKGHKLVSDVIFDDGDNKYKVIGSFDLY